MVAVGVPGPSRTFPSQWTGGTTPRAWCHLSRDAWMENDAAAAQAVVVDPLVDSWGLLWVIRSFLVSAQQLVC